MCDAVVFGGSGCLGQRVVTSLREAGAGAVAASRRGGDGLRVDVLDPTSFSTPELREAQEHVGSVVFAAGSARPDQAVADVDVHLRGLANVLRWAADAPRLERFVLVSSILVYGDSRSPRPTGLDFGQHHASAYGFAKQRSEELLLDSGLPGKRVRVGLLVGDAATGALPSDQPVADFARLCLRLPMLPLAQGGRFPAWTVAVDRAGDDVAACALHADAAGVSLSADPQSPTLASLAETLAAPYGRVPLVVDPGARLVRSWTVRRALARAGVTGDWAAFASPWADLTRADVAAHQSTGAAHNPDAPALTARYLARAHTELAS